MKTPKVNYERASAVIITVLGVGAVIFLFFKYLFFIVLPFLLAWAMALALRPLVNFLAKKTKIPKRGLAATITMLVFFVVGWLFFALVARVFDEAKQFVEGLVADQQVFAAKIQNFSDTLRNFLSDLPIIGNYFAADGEGALSLETIIPQLMSSLLLSFGTGMPALAGKIVVALPGILLLLIVSVLAALYFSMDLEKINAAVFAYLPEKWRETAGKFRSGIIAVALGYMRAYLIIMLIIFALLLVGFLILQIKYAVLLALLFAVLDLLPVIGVGTFIIPWSVYSFAVGDLRMGIGLVIIYAVILIVRQLIEPQLVGTHVGLHPLLALLGMYVGFRLFGAAGLLLGPILTLLAKSIVVAVTNPQVKVKVPPLGQKEG